MAVTLNASTSSGLVQTADTSGTIELQSNGTTRLTVASTGAYGQLVSATAQASTSGTAIDFTGIPSWVKRITVMFNGVSTSGTSIPLIQIGDSGGIETTGYLGSCSWIRSGTPVSASPTTGLGLVANPLAADVMHGQAVLVNMESNVWSLVFNGALSSAANTLNAGASKTLSATLDRVRITTTNGTDTFDAGTINILYEG
jgi:hypothetical protein